MSEYTDHKMMKDLEEELKDQKLTHLLKVVKALIFENIKLEDAEREKKKEEHGIDALFKEEKKEEAAAAPAAAPAGEDTITFKHSSGFEYIIMGEYVDSTKQEFKAKGGDNYTKVKVDMMGFETEGNDITIQKDQIFQQVMKSEGMNMTFVWEMKMNRESARSLEEKLELMRSINVELVELIKSKLL